MCRTWWRWKVSFTQRVSMLHTHIWRTAKLTKPTNTEYPPITRETQKSLWASQKWITSKRTGWINVSLKLLAAVAVMHFTEARDMSSLKTSSYKCTSKDYRSRSPVSMFPWSNVVGCLVLYTFLINSSMHVWSWLWGCEYIKCTEIKSIQWSGISPPQYFIVTHTLKSHATMHPWGTIPSWLIQKNNFKDKF